jgi:mono/diheme cytochrome c family protein
MKSYKVLVRSLAAAGFTAAVALTSTILVADSTGAKNPAARDPASLAAGRQLYATNCAACHGATGQGNGKMAHDLETEPADLTDSDSISGNEGALFRQISQARKPMPSYEKLLTPQERWQIVSYVKTLPARK